MSGCLGNWSGYKPKAVTQIDPLLKKFTGKVVEVGTRDILVVKNEDMNFQKVFFSSYRSPKYVHAAAAAAAVVVVVVVVVVAAATAAAAAAAAV